MAFSIVGILSVILEFLRPVLGWLILIVVLDLGLLALAWREPARLRWKAALGASLACGAALMVAALLFLPALTGASFDDLSGALDYLALTGLSIGFGVALSLLCYPLWQLYHRD